MVAKKRKKSVKRGVAAKSKGSHGPKDTELADIGIRSAEQTLKIQALVLENMAEGVNVCDENELIAYTNAAFDTMFGYEQGELVGKEVSVLNALAPEENRRFVDSILQHLKTHGHWSGEVHNQKKDGTYFSTRAVISNLESQGKIYWISVQEHISERMKADRALQESEIRYKALFESSPDGILIADVETRKFQYANPALCAMLGYTAAELNRMGVADIHPKGALKHVISEFEAQVRGEKTLAPDIPCLRKDQTLVYADVNSRNVVLDGRQCNVGFFRNTTERKKAEERLQASEQRYRLLLGSITDGVQVQDHELRYLLVNDELARMAQMPKETLLGRKATDLFPEFEQTVFFETFKKVLKTGKSAVTSDEFVFEDGRRRWFEAHVYPAPEGILVMVRDITDRKEAEKALSEKNIALREVLDGIQEQKNEMGRTILSNVDKIIMPLIHILEPGLPEEQQGYMDLLKQSLQEIASPFVSRLSTTVGALTPAEIRICGLIRRELSNKEIAQLEHISPATVSKHRAHIRHKLGITNKKVNLATYLESFMSRQEEI